MREIDAQIPAKKKQNNYYVLMNDYFPSEWNKIK